MPKPGEGIVINPIGRFDPPKSYCAHVRYHNVYAYFYSENYAEAWATEGDCGASEQRFQVDTIRLGFRYKGEGLRTKQCNGTDSCQFSERNWGTGKEINCAAATLNYRERRAEVSSNPAECR